VLFRVDDSVFLQFPDVRIGVLAVEGLDNVGEAPEIGTLLRAAEAGLAASFEGTPVTEHPRIAPWRDAYRKFGAKPKNYRSSIESLIRKTLKGEPLRHINKLVDTYNAVSLRHLLPAGGEDLDRIEGDMLLTCAGESESPVRLLGEREERSPKPGEVIYKDEEGAICRRWNWKEAERTKLTEDTRRAILVIEALPPVEPKELDAALSGLRDLVQQYCGGSSRAYTLHRENPSIEIE
jgi:DNA/RNA-binding domain of Phe-tRNA-synthetase-like protein